MKKYNWFSHVVTKHERFIRIMKATVLSLFLGIGVSFATESYSQSIYFTLEARNKTVKEVFANIESSSEYIFFYLDGTLDVNRKVSVNVKNQLVGAILDQVFEGTDNRYDISDRQIVITKVEAAPPAQAPVPQNRSVTGNVRDASGPIAGASVSIRGTSSGAITDVDGNFTLSGVSAATILDISFVGYTPREVTVGNQSQVNVVLVVDTQQIEQVVVVGYGTVQKKDLTGSVSQVRSADLKDLAVTRLDQAMSGKLAGVQIIQTTGEPGADLNVRIRGVGSMSAGTQPLYVIDGFPGANLSMINPNDIETIDVLKDASATAIYGSRGANGVVIITTKRGQEGRARINLDVYYGWQSVLREPEYLTSKEQADYYYLGIVNQNLDEDRPMTGDPTTWHYPVPRTIMDVREGRNTYETDAYDYIFRTAPIQNYNISASGGSNTVRYAISGEYAKQDGIIVANNFERFSVRANVDAQLTKFVSTRLSISSVYSEAKNIMTSGGSGDAEGILGAATTWLKWYPMYREDGYYFSGYGQDATNNVWNPMAQADNIKRGTQNGRTMANLNTEFAILPELKLNVMLGANVSNRHTYYFIPKLDVFNNTADGEDRRSNDYNWIQETTLNYQKSFGDHSITGLLGYTTQKQWAGSNRVRSQSYPNNLVYTLNAVSNNIYQGESVEDEWSMISYLARINYNYKSKYYLTASIRSDGSSRFGMSNKFGHFPSAALAWRASEENFLKGSSWLDNLKLRASFGSTGNNDIANYAHLATIAYESYPLGGSAIGGFAPANFQNDKLTWEKQHSYNLGLDVGMFDSRVNLTFDYFLTRNSPFNTF